MILEGTTVYWRRQTQNVMAASLGLGDNSSEVRVKSKDKVERAGLGMARLLSSDKLCYCPAVRIGPHISSTGHCYVICCQGFVMGKEACMILSA